MDGFEKPQILTHIEKDLNHSLFDCKWVPCSTKFVVLGSKPNGAGVIEIYEISQGKLEKVSELERPDAFKSGSFGASNMLDRRLATGNFKGCLDVWDLECSRSVYTAKDHNDIINSLDGVAGSLQNCGAPEIATGSRDGCVKVWDVRQKSKPVANMEPSSAETRRDCWTVCFGNSYSDSERVLCAGYDNGDLKMFDLRTMSLRWESNLKNGICSIEFDRKDIPMNKIVATTLEGKFHVFDLRTQNPKKGFAQVVNADTKNGTVWTCSHLPQNREVFMTCAGTGQVMLWQYKYPEKRQKVDANGVVTGVPGSLERLQKMTISTQPLNSFQWCPDHQGLAIATSFDQCIRVLITTKLNLI